MQDETENTIRRWSRSVARHAVAYAEMSAVIESRFGSSPGQGHKLFGVESAVYAALEDLHSRLDAVVRAAIEDLRPLRHGGRPAQRLERLLDQIGREMALPPVHLNTETAPTSKGHAKA